VQVSSVKEVLSTPSGVLLYSLPSEIRASQSFTIFKKIFLKGTIFHHIFSTFYMA
jgi:hypothetical protein